MQITNNGANATYGKAVERHSNSGKITRSAARIDDPDRHPDAEHDAARAKPPLWCSACRQTGAGKNHGDEAISAMMRDGAGTRIGCTCDRRTQRFPKQHHPNEPTSRSVHPVDQGCARPPFSARERRVPRIRRVDASDTSKIPACPAPTAASAL